MKIEAITTIKYLGDYKTTGTVFECEEKEAKRLIKMGVATDSVDPKMMKVAADMLNEANKQRESIVLRLNKATESNKKIMIEVKQLQAKANKMPHSDQKDNIINKIDKIKSNTVNPKELKDLLKKKDLEVKKLAIK